MDGPDNPTPHDSLASNDAQRAIGLSVHGRERSVDDHVVSTHMIAGYIHACGKPASETVAATRRGQYNNAPPVPAIAPTTVSEPTLYRVSFLNQGEVYEVYARSVRSSDIFGFVELADFVFGERSTVVIDPGEDKLRSEFEKVKSSLIPMHSVVRIDVVDKSGAAKVTPAGEGSNVTPFPVYTQRGPNKR